MPMNAQTEDAETKEKPRALTVKGFLQRYQIKRDCFYGEVKAGRIKLRKVGNRSLIGIDDAERWWESLPTAQPKKQPAQ